MVIQVIVESKEHRVLQVPEDMTVTQADQVQEVMKARLGL